MKTKYDENHDLVEIEIKRQLDAQGDSATVDVANPEVIVEDQVVPLPEAPAEETTVVTESSTTATTEVPTSKQRAPVLKQPQALLQQAPTTETPVTAHLLQGASYHGSSCGTSSCETPATTERACNYPQRQ